MPELQQLTRTRTEQPETAEPPAPAASEPTTEPTETDTTLEVDGASVTVSGEPTEAEAAVIAAVVAEHLQTEAAAAEEEEEPRYAVDPWCLSGRLDIRSPERTPRACPSGTEWKVAGRAASW